jgi:hypothetical protein
MQTGQEKPSGPSVLLAVLFGSAIGGIYHEYKWGASSSYTTHNRESVQVVFDGGGANTVGGRGSESSNSVHAESSTPLQRGASTAMGNGRGRLRRLEPLWEGAQNLDLWAPWNTVNPSLQEDGTSGAKIFVTCSYNKGRSGHELKDVATPFILGVMYGWEPCTGLWWRTKSVKMFNPGMSLVDCEYYSAKDVIKYDAAPLEERMGGVTSVKRIDFTSTSYDGMAFEEVEALAARVRDIAAAAGPGAAVLVRLHKSTRVHMHQAYNWRYEGKIPHAVFEPVRRTLQARWFHRMNRLAYSIPNVQLAPTLDYLSGSPGCKGNMNSTAQCVQFTADAYSEPIEGLTLQQTPPAHSGPDTIVVAAHFRRGDTSGHMSQGEFTSQRFAQRLANDLHSILDHCDGTLKINMHTEKQGADDLKKAPGLQNISKLFHKESWEHDMSAFINADVLVVTNSSMSTWAAIFATGITVMPSGYVKHFGFNPPPPNLIPYTSEQLQLPKPWLQHRGCLASAGTPGEADAQATQYQFGKWQRR